ncbi:NEQ127 [Nanoarchaeum equitans Kin4-M]|uniref:NEQ127 n=1 Tax=Nanoarchaeum equitans (strain Kin4-M) TaxID=228908 RepID=Q74MM3_NANEQ|nr:NEQ127 [Nanoarchaeum equitans Kin4-M]
MKILGTKWVGHDSSVFLLDPENQEIFAASTERYTRIKHDPFHIGPILKELNLETRRDIKHIGIPLMDWYMGFPGFLNNYHRIVRIRIAEILREMYKPKYIKDWKKIMDKKKTEIFKDALKKGKFSKLLKESILLVLTNTIPLPKFIDRKLTLKAINDFFKRYSINAKIEFYDHHLSHAASAYYFSPFNGKEAIVFTLDGYGDGNFSTVWYFNGKERKLLHNSPAWIMGKRFLSIYKSSKDHQFSYFNTVSIGNVYSLFTYVLGFTPGSDEGKTEALAAYGKPDKELYGLLNKAFPINKDKLRWEINKEIVKKYFTIKRVDLLKKWKERIGDENFAATIQRWLEDTVVNYLNLVYEKYKIPRLAMAGGVVANVIMNLNIFERTPFEELYIFPAMADDGTSAGAAVLKAIELGYDISWLKDYEMPYWGPSYSKEDVEKALKRWADKIEYEYIGDKWPELAAEMVAKGLIVAIFQGRMEFGPRALGNRSILADPRDPKSRDKLNLKVKRRPWFQPFCPSVLEEERERLFEKSYKHKHMAIAFRLKKEYWDKLPSARHVDGTARPQFVEEKDNPNYYRLLKKLKELTGFGVVVNTSFNLHGRTIVRTPEDALTDFIDCNIDALFIEGYLVRRKEKQI